MLRERNYDVNELNAYVLTNESLLVIDQRAAYNAKWDRIERKVDAFSFHDAPGGTGGRHSSSTYSWLEFVNNPRL
jgi:hypothetical protein